MPRTMNDVIDQKLTESEIALITNWYIKLIDPHNNKRTDYIKSERETLQSYLVEVPGVYFEMLSNVLLVPEEEKKQPSEYLDVSENIGAALNRMVSNDQIRDFHLFYHLIEDQYPVKDVERAMAYRLDAEIQRDTEEIHSENVDYDKMDHLKNKRADKEAFSAYIKDLREEDAAKAEYLEKESALWEKENEKLDKVRLDLYDAKHQSKILRQKRADDPEAFTKADQKALEKADKAQKDLNKKADKIRDTMQKDYEKRLKKMGNPYPDVANNRRVQIGTGDFRYMNRVQRQEPTAVREPVGQPVNFVEMLAERGVDAIKYTAKQVPNPQLKQTESTIEIIDELEPKSK